MAKPSSNHESPFESERRAAQQRLLTPNTRYPQPPDELFPFKRDVHLWLSGTFNGGGRGLIQEADLLVKFDLGPVLFTVLAVLVSAGKRAAPRKPFSAAGFVSAENLATQLALWSAKGKEDRVINDIHALREKLADAWSKHVPRRQASRWARELIERNHCGYRLSTPPSQVHMDIVDERPKHATRNESKTNRFPIQLGPTTRSDTVRP